GPRLERGPRRGNWGFETSGRGGLEPDDRPNEVGSRRRSRRRGRYGERFTSWSRRGSGRSRGRRAAGAGLGETPSAPRRWGGGMSLDRGGDGRGRGGGGCRPTPTRRPAAVAVVVVTASPVDYAASPEMIESRPRGDEDPVESVRGKPGASLT